MMGRDQPEREREWERERERRAKNKNTRNAIKINMGYINVERVDAVISQVGRLERAIACKRVEEKMPVCLSWSTW